MCRLGINQTNPSQDLDCALLVTTRAQIYLNHLYYWTTSYLDFDGNGSLQ